MDTPPTLVLPAIWLLGMVMMVWILVLEQVGDDYVYVSRVYTA